MDFIVKEIKTTNDFFVEVELKNNNGIRVKVINLGAAITEIHTPDKNGKYENIILRYDNYENYIENSLYLGAVIGRNSGLIDDGKIKIEGTEYNLERNKDNHTLNGGYSGLTYKKFSYYPYVLNNTVNVSFSYRCEHEEGGFPGEVYIKVTYTLDNKNKLTISYEGFSDRETILNLSNHSCFNLGGNIKASIEDYELAIKSDKIAEQDEELLLTGKMLNVDSTPYDFRRIKSVNKDINSNLLEYNNYFKFIEGIDERNRIELYNKKNGRGILVSTNYNGVVLYTTIDESNKLNLKDSIVLKTQNSPIGRDNMFIEESLLKKGEKYKKYTTYKFFVR